MAAVQLWLRRNEEANVEPEPAYGEQRSLALGVVNTLVTGSSAQLDRIPDDESLDTWLHTHALISHSTRDSSAHEEFLKLRTAVRALLSAVEAGSSLPAAALARVNSAVAPSVRVALTDARVLHLETVGTPSTIREIALEVIRFLVSADADRVRTCAAEDCDRMFLQDHRRRVWCSPRCGARMRARRYAARQMLSAGHG
jgi:predicted RNA-binding Zn ribbon-like protein